MKSKNNFNCSFGLFIIKKKSSALYFYATDEKQSFNFNYLTQNQ